MWSNRFRTLCGRDTGVDGDAQRISQLCWMFFLKIIDDQDQELELTQDGYEVTHNPRIVDGELGRQTPEGITGEKLLAFVNDDLFPTLKSLKITPNSGNRGRVCAGGVFEMLSIS